MRRIWSATVMAGVLLIGAACSGGDKDSENSSGGGRTLFQPAGVVGPDSFAPTFELTQYDVDLSALSEGDVDGSAPGLYAGRTYGGTGTNICDIEAMIRFLTYYEDRGRAWADVQGIAFEQLPDYLRSLTPVYALQNLNVQMFGFKNDQAYGYDAVIAAGTAILIDDQGMPRARCACGNPLLAPSEEPPTDDSVPPGDSSPDITTAEEPPSSDVPPGDQPGDQPGGGDSECPEEFEGNEFVDAAGALWKWVDGNNDPADSDHGAHWYDAATDTYKTTQELDGAFVDCPGPNDQPRGGQPDCPELLVAGWTDYGAPNGDVWHYDQAVGAWINLSDPAAEPIADVVALPGWRDLCDDGRQRQVDPVCPQRLIGGGWTPYLDINGDEWQFDPTKNWWKNVTAAPSPDPVTDMNDLPGWTELCGDPQPGQPDGPCPPVKAAVGDIWTAPDGRQWQLWLDGTALVWDEITTPDLQEGVPYADLVILYECAPPFEEGQPECPPTKPIVGQTWIDIEGNLWLFDNHTGGVYGWDNTDTPDVELVATTDLPNQPEGCGPDVVQDPCPDFQPRVGDVFVSPNGDVWVWDSTANVWTNNTDPSAPPITVTSRLPGYRELCMPPCPPLNIAPGENGHWIDPFTGTLWVWFEGAWVNTDDKTQKVASSADLPGWMELCAPPCLPGLSVPMNSFVIDESGQPEQNPEATEQNGDGSQKAVTVTPGSGPVEIVPINEDQVSGTKAALDLCNPEGCVEPGASPELGHEFIDNRGVRWTYVTEGVWHSDLGESTSDVLLIPGYREQCLPEDDPSDDPCPPEFEGSVYVDSSGIRWIWVGSNSDAAESDHGRRWFSSASGSPEYRATIELETWFDDCPPPTDPDIVPLASSIEVDVRVQGPVCVGDTVQIVMFAVPSEGERITEYKITINDEGDGSNQENATTFTDSFVPDAVGEYKILGLAADSSGKSGQDTEFVKAIDCADPQDQGQPSDGATTTTAPAATSTTVSKTNNPPKITLTTKSLCIEAGSEAPTKVSVTVTVNDADGDKVAVVVKGSSANRTIPSQSTQVVGSGSGTYSFNVDYSDRGTNITIDGQADDGKAKSTASLTIKVTNPGGCGQNTTTATTTATTTTAAPKSTTTTTAPKATTTTTAPKTTTTVAGQTAGSAANTAPTVALNTAVNKSWPQCLSAKGSPVSFVVSDAAGSVLTVVLQVNGQTTKSDTVQLSGTSQAFTVTFNAQQAGAAVTITATDQGKLSGSLKQTLTKEVCP
jgi:hypothetical protein